jgi:hypothetical protein
MSVTSNLSNAERTRQDSSVSRAAKHGRMAEVTRIRGPIRPHSSGPTAAVEAESANRLIWREDQSTLTSSGRPLGE